MFLEEIREVEQLAGVAPQAGEFGKNQRLDVAAFNVFEHPLRLGVLHHGFARDAFEVIDLDHHPAFGIGIAAAALFMVLRAFAPALVFGRDADPDPDAASGTFLGVFCFHRIVPLPPPLCLFFAPSDCSDLLFSFNSFGKRRFGCLYRR